MIWIRKLILTCILAGPQGLPITHIPHYQPQAEACRPLSAPASPPAALQGHPRQAVGGTPYTREKVQANKTSCPAVQTDQMKDHKTTRLQQ